MRLPRGIKVGGVTYGVDADESWSAGSESIWTVRESLSLLKIPAHGVAPQRLQETLLAATVMAVSINYAAGVDDDLQPEVAESLAFGLYQVLRGNPQVQDYITRDPAVAAELPGEVVIGGLTYTIRIDDSFSEAAETYATINHLTLNIRARNKDVSSQQMQKTLLHELLHGIDRVYGARKNDLSEAWIDSLAHGLYQVFRDNPRLLAYVNAGAVVP